MIQSDNCITVEGDSVYFTVNGQKIPADRVKFLPREKVEELSDRARLAATAGVSFITIGSISPPVRRPRTYHDKFRCVDYTT